MTVTVGSSLIAGSGANAQDVNALIETVNTLITKVEELTEEVKSGISGSGSLSENVTLTLIFVGFSAGNATSLSANTSKFMSNSSAYLRVNGTDYYSQIVGKSLTRDYNWTDVIFQVQIPRGSSVLVECLAYVQTVSNSSSKSNYWVYYEAQTCVADTHCTIKMTPRETDVIM